MNELKKKELTATEMDSVVGGYEPYSYMGASGAASTILANNPDCFNNLAERQLYDSFTEKEKREVCDQPDRASQRAKMFEIMKRRENNSVSTTLHVGVSGSW